MTSEPDSVIPPFPAHLEEANERYLEYSRNLQSSLEKETDRGLALVGGEVLNEGLGDVLRKVFQPEADRIAKQLLSGALRGFSPKMDLCYALGLFSKQTYEQLERIRAIRNEFAHTHHPKDFGDKKIQELVSGLYSFANPRVGEPSNVEFEGGSRHRFMFSILSVASTLYVLHAEAKHREWVPVGNEMFLLNHSERDSLIQWLGRVQEGRAANPRAWIDRPRKRSKKARV
ncbi:MAG: MltR family transcriptional regulator [Phycisphaerales bacterium JB059]